MAFKWCSIGTKGPKVCQENIPHIITPPPPAWTVETRQNGSMFQVLYAKFWPYHLNVAAEIDTHHTRQLFFQSSTVQFWWACANCSLRGSQNHTVIVGKGSNRQKYWKTKEFVGPEGFFMKNSRQLNCSGQTKDSWTTITKQKKQRWIIQVTTQY